MALEDDFCDIIRKARTGLGFEPAETAARAGIAALRLAALEAGQTPSAGEVERLADALGLRALPLRQIATFAAEPDEPEPLPDVAVTAVFAREVGAFAYAVRGPQGAFLVDCGGGVQELLGALGGDAEGVLLTHGHHDHVGGLDSLPEGIPVYGHPLLCRTLPRARPLADGERKFGLSCWYAPGHSADMLAFVGDGLAFVGDTIFAGSLGRAAQGQYETLLRTARRILTLPAETVLHCGHGPRTTVGWERAHNAFPVA